MEKQGENKPQMLPQYVINKSKLVRQTCQKVVKNAKYVTIQPDYISKLALKFKYTNFNSFTHHQTSQDAQQILNYLFVLDSLNFCFWPLEHFQYEHLASSVKDAISKNGTLNPYILQQIDSQKVRNLIFNGIQVPLEEERARILRQVGNVVVNKFSGKFTNVVLLANKSAVKLLQVLTSFFPNFQDHSIYKGNQIHFYKRAQILIGDIWAKFQNKQLGQFYDIEELTMFPDYRIPQILNYYNILKYSQQLEEAIKHKHIIGSGSEMEIQIRACSVVAVEMMRKQISLNIKRNVVSVEVDWFLWEEGETNLNTICNHHRTLTIYY